MNMDIKYKNEMFYAFEKACKTYMEERARKKNWLNLLAWFNNNYIKYNTEQGLEMLKAALISLGLSKILKNISEIKEGY